MGKLPKLPCWHVLPVLALSLVVTAIAWGQAAESPTDPTASAAPVESTQTRIEQPWSPQDLLILELVLESRFGSYMLIEGFPAYQYQEQTWLPLSTIAEALEFAIAVDSANGRASGWYIRENRTFNLNLSSNVVRINGKQSPLEAGTVYPFDRDLYVRMADLERWFDIHIDLQKNDLRLVVTSDEPLPLEQRLERERRRNQLARATGGGVGFPIQETPYKAMTWPTIDVLLESGYRSSETGRATVPQNNRYSILGAGDLLWMNSTWFITGYEDDEVYDMRLTFGRQDPRGGLLGPLDATNFSLGDISSPQTSLISQSRQGRGFDISNYPLVRPQEFSRTTLRGNRLPGWEVELYRNDVLLDFQTIGDDGQYEFIDVPLLFGINDLRIVSYGPLGEVREELQPLFIGPGMLAEGEWHYRVSASEEGQSLVGIDRPGANPENLGNIRWFAEAEHGLSNELSLVMGTQSLKLDDGKRHNYLLSGMRVALDQWFLRGDFIADTQGGTAAEVSLQTRIGALGLFAEHAQFFDDYQSERIDQPLRSQSRLRLDGSLPTFLDVPWSYTISLERDYFLDGHSELSLDHRLSTIIERFILTNTMSGRYDDQQNELAWIGTFSARRRLGLFSPRLQINYAMHPDARVTEFTFVTDFDITQRLRGSFGVEHHFDESTTDVTASLNRIFDNFALGVDVAVSDDQSYAVGMTLTFGLGREPQTGDWFASAYPLVGSGIISSHVHLEEPALASADQQVATADKADASKSAEGKPIEGVQMFIGRTPSKTRTSSEGVVMLHGLPLNEPVDVSINKSTLADPFWTPRNPGKSVILRPGVIPVVDFGVVLTGEIDGTVYIEVPGGTEPSSGIRMQLLDTEQQLVTTTLTAYDGFYLFERVPPGHYFVQPDPEQMQRLGVALPTAEPALVDVDGTIVSGLDLVLTRKEQVNE